MLSLDEVRAFVYEKYKDNHQSRYQHILGVAEMAVHLAHIYGVDPIQAEIAGLMHDYSKYDSITEIQKYLSDDEIKECEVYPFLYHAYGSAYVYINQVGNDKDVFQAIYHHVFGRPNMSMLEAIIMISDYTEVNRTYPSCVTCREILFEKGLEEAILYSLEKTIEHVKESGDIPHPRQLEVYNEYLEKVGK